MAKLALKLTILCMMVLQGCTSKQTTTCEDPNSADCPLVQSDPAGGSQNPIKILSISPLVARPGQTVTIKGQNLADDTELSIGDQKVSWTSISPDTAVFTMPMTPRPGAFSISAARRGQQSDTQSVTIESAAKFMISDSAGDAYPIFMAAPAEVCAPTPFRDADGVLQVGIKECGGTSLPQCAIDGQTDCVANSAYPAVDINQVSAGNIRSGVVIAGQTGAYSGPAINPWDLRAGVTVGAYTGKLKVNCRNGINSAKYNYDGELSSIDDSAENTGTALNIWDTIDDNNGGDLTFLSVFPNDLLPGSWTNSNFCTGVEVTAGDDNVWKDVTTIGNGITSSTCAATPAHCTFQDKISGLHWSKNQSSVNQQTWMSGLNICDNLVHNGFSDWRLPTQKELMDAYNHGIRSVTRDNWITDSEMGNNFLSASSDSGTTSNYIYVNLRNGGSGTWAKSTGLNMVVCVR